MKNNEFFKALESQGNPTWGEINALDAWQKGIEEHLDFPLLRDTMWKEDIADFLKTIEEAGFKKFGFFVRSTITIQNIVAFTKAGWKLTGTVKFDDYRFDEGLVFERA